MPSPEYVVAATEAELSLGSIDSSCESPLAIPLTCGAQLSDSELRTSASSSTREIHFFKLGADSAATSGLHWDRANSLMSDAYVGPTDRPLPSRGTRPSRISRFREWRAMEIRVCLASSKLSGLGGMRACDTPRKRAISSESANSHASASRTAIRKHIRREGCGNHSERFCPGQDPSLSRSTSTSQGENAAAEL